MEWTSKDGFRVEAGLEPAPKHAEAKELVYSRLIIPAIKGVMKAQGLQITIQGAEHIPADGAGLIACNHTSYMDFIFAGIPARLRGKRLVRFMTKREIFDVKGVGTLMRAMKHIRVDRAAGAASLDEAVRRLKAGQLVGIFPEGTISRDFELGQLKSGAVRIAQAADAPLIPMAMWGAQQLWTKGHKKKMGRHHFPIWMKVGQPIDASGDVEAATQRLHSAMAELLAEVQHDYEQTYGAVKMERAKMEPAKTERTKTEQ
ncbi:lysophospholipid acyltransferase family protein [Corynebacterium pelargi]|uniref:1-acyl-sn-glycerol-3-phosphate acyltransferase n=1 Tax=Corynebacterium pelargi TaxID=1471400 RepID=A0A410W688_9CORY|nr:lysophospholipid acyltransferase family protein [Corynebacterium pelargi]QAU51475.1 1-acyl-sn-glycerol-3-phosphate acyltransferase [Corynebacterium pelargi]GGG79435.1 1-acyl-sn-glycerol-3-phosphate acyltransferase [Corynebacterium pelargi]